MKKIAKLLLASSMLAALVLACNNGSGFVAHDELDAPDVEAYATASGVIVLEWDAVKDATSYTVTVKKPGQEYFTTDGGNAFSNGGTAGVYRYVYSYDQADADYEFRVVASTSATSLMLTGVTEVSVTTPDEEDIADGLAEIALNVTVEKLKGEANRYKVTYPVDLGYRYKGALVSNSDKATSDAETTYKQFGVSGSFIYGSSAFTTIENADGDDILVFDDVTFDTSWDAVGKYSYVLYAEPLNTKFGAKKLYALSSEVSVTADDVNDVSNPTWVEDDEGAVVVRLDLQKQNAVGSTYDIPAPAASTYTVWQKETETVTVWSTNSSYATQTVTVKWTSAPVKQAETTKDYAEYFATLPEKKDSTPKTVGTQTTYTSYDYDYYVTYNNKEGDKVWFTAAKIDPTSDLYKNRRINKILQANYTDFSADFKKWIDAHEYYFEEDVVWDWETDTIVKKPRYPTELIYNDLSYEYYYGSTGMKAAVWEQIVEISDR